MLVHTSVRVSVHESFVGPVDAFDDELLRAFASGDKELLDALRKTLEARDDAGAAQSRSASRRPTSTTS